jgi:hypothetical protein
VWFHSGGWSQPGRHRETQAQKSKQTNKRPQTLWSFERIAKRPWGEAGGEGREVGREGEEERRLSLGEGDEVIEFKDQWIQPFTLADVCSQK